MINCSIIAEEGCTEPVVTTSDNLIYESLFNGAVYQYSCDHNTTLVGSPTLVCDGSSYNDTVPVCVSAPTQVTVSGPAVVTVGTPATYTCVTNIGQEPGRLHWRVVDMSNRDLTHAIRDQCQKCGWWGGHNIRNDTGAERDCQRNFCRVLQSEWRTSNSTDIESGKARPKITHRHNLYI